MTSTGYETLPFPKIRRLMEDGGRLGREKHLIHGLFEMNVTEERRAIRRYRAHTGQGLSFMAFVVACLGRAVERHKSVQACRAWGDKIVLFEDVDVNTMFEVEVDGQKIIRPHILRAVNRKSPLEIHAEIKAFQDNPQGREAKFIDWFVLLPGFLRRFFLRMLFRNPHWLKEMNGTVALTSVGMFGSGGGWGLPVSNHTLQVTLGGIATQPALMEDGRLENRQMLCVTISFDHDLVDGAPAARFAHTLKELIEGQSILDELTEPRKWKKDEYES